MLFNEIAADLEGQLAVITDALSRATWFAPDKRLPYIPSLLHETKVAQQSRKCSFIPYLDPRTDCADLWCARIRKKGQRTRLDMAVALVLLRGTVERLALETAKNRCRSTQKRDKEQDRQLCRRRQQRAEADSCRRVANPSSKVTGPAGMSAKPKDGGVSSDFVAISIVLAPITRVIASRNVFKSKWVASAL